MTEANPYLVEHHLSKTNDQCRQIFNELRNRILRYDDRIEERAVRLLVRYKAKNNFAEIHFLSDRLKIHLRPKIYLDPKKRVETLANPGFTMDRRVYISEPEDIDYIMSLIRQSYEDVAFAETAPRFDKTAPKKWRPFIYRQIIDLCNEQGMRSFDRQLLLDRKAEAIRNFSPAAKTPEQTVSRILQELRDEGKITFNDRGIYTLSKRTALKGEVPKHIRRLINKKPSHKVEYLHETYARNRGWVTAAKERYGHQCLYPKCDNHFVKPDGSPYIEVHHIIPLFEGGEDSLWNLVTVCAHHHKMAHFAEVSIQNRLRDMFLEIVERGDYEPAKG